MTKYVTATAEGFEEYHAARGREVPGTWDDDKINASLLNASEWVDYVYGNSFIGQKTGGFLQERQWPRINAVIQDIREPYTFATDAIPDRVVNAVYEAAWRDASVPGSLQVDYTPGKYKSVTIEGAISVDYAMFSSAAAIQKTFPIIDQILEPLFDNYYNTASKYTSGSVRV